MAAPVSSLTVSSSRSPLTIVAGLVGFTAITAQIVLMRELIVVFSGNEISLGIMLATWLLWTAIGSWLASYLADHLKRTPRIVAILQCLCGLTLPATVWAVRASKGMFQTVPGELIGPFPMLLTCLTGLALFCTLSGGLYVAAARLYKEERLVSASVASSSTYLFEGAGSALGGALASLFFLRYLDSFQIATLVTMANLCLAAILLFGKSTRRIVAVFLVTGALGLLLFISVAPRMRRSSEERLWRGFHLLESRDSIYGNLAVLETGNIRSIYDNGIILSSAPDEAAAEEGVHYALLEHPAPASILLIGGGINGSLGEALKHPSVKRLDYVELDPTLISIGKKFFPVESAPFLSDARVHIHYADGRQLLRTTRDRFDVVLLNLPDPQTAQLNRFYTVEFFRDVGAHLNPGGLLALQLRASEDYISPELAEFLRCIYRTLRESFPYTAVIPGETIHFFASPSPDILTEDAKTLTARLRQRNVQTRYVREYFLPFRMMPDRMAQARSLLRATEATPVNHDFRPIAYYFDATLWSAQFRTSHDEFFHALLQIRFSYVAIGTVILALSLALLPACLPKSENRVRATAVSCVTATGFTLMALQLCLLLAFQSIYGYMYNQLAILIGMFMGGIALGTWLAIRRPAGKQAPIVRKATTAQFLLAGSTPLLMGIITLLARSSGTTAMILAPQLAFPALATACGLLGGFQFAVCTGLFVCHNRPETSLGVLYAVDLLGGCVGALLLSGYLIPVFGFWRTAWLSAAVNLGPALLAGRVSLEWTPPHPA